MKVGVEGVLVEKSERGRRTEMDGWKVEPCLETPSRNGLEHIPPGVVYVGISAQ